MNGKPQNELDWRTLLWEDTPTTTLYHGGDSRPVGVDHVVMEEDDHHSKRRRERRIDPLHRPLQVRA